MTPPNARTARSGGREYNWRGETFPSVTTIIKGGLAKEALINWAKKYTAEFAVSHFDALAELVKTDPPGAVEWLKGAAYRERDRAADLGSAVHAAVEKYMLGQPFPPWPAEIAPRMRAFEQFVARYEPEFQAAEASVYNRAQCYAGTLDCIAVIGGRTLVGDWKTSKKGVYPDVALQLAAYRHAEFLGLAGGEEAPMPATDGAFALRLADDEFEAIDIDTGPEIFRAFLYVRESYRFSTFTSKSVLRGPLLSGGDATQIELAKAVGA